MSSNIGLFYALLSYVWWGLCPLFWKALEGVAPLEILAHRILWSFVFLAPLFLKKNFRAKISGALSSDSRQWLFLLGAATIIGINWGAFVLAMVTERILEASLGYFIAPLVFVSVGVWLLKERLNRFQKISVLLAATGITLLWIRVGTLPWIALTLAFTFTFYGYFKKRSQLEASSSVALETLILGIPAVIYLIYAGQSHDLYTWGLLVASGPVTLLPQVWFTLGAKRISLSTVGFLQYLAPTINFLIGLLVFHETFDSARSLTFCLIWIGLAIYCWDLWRKHRMVHTAVTPSSRPSA